MPLYYQTRSIQTCTALVICFVQVLRLVCATPGQDFYPTPRPLPTTAESKPQPQVEKHWSNRRDDTMELVDCNSFLMLSN